MTDVTGKNFLSYRSSRLGEAELLLAAQHDVGIPTWQDRKDLNETPTAEELRHVLCDSKTASSLLWITPDVKTSPSIRTLEVPEILQRLNVKDGFFLIPVCAGGLEYKDISDLLGNELSLEKFEHWNLRKVLGNPIETLEAALTAKQILARRVATIHHHLEPTSPIELTINTRSQIAFKSGTWLSLQWAGRFNGREATSDTWEQTLVPALSSVSDVIHKCAPGRKIIASGLAAIPAAVALGSAFLATSGHKVAWSQYTPGQTNELWSLDSGREATGFSASIKDYEIGGKDLAVLVSVTDNVEPAVARTLKDSDLDVRTIIHVQKEGAARFNIESPPQANDIAHIIVETIRKVRSTHSQFTTIHFFMAVPVGLAMLVGQLLNTLGNIQTYEHIPIDGTGIYKSAALLHP